MTKITLFAWWNYTDGHLFDDLTVPAGADRQTLIDTILLRGGEFGTVYNDPFFIQHQVKTLAAQYQHSMERTWRALLEDYDPLHNYDRYEESEDTADGSSTSKSDNQDTLTSAMQGDTAMTYNPTSQTTSDGHSTSSDSSKASGTHKAHLYGNIGVTTSATMLSEELDIRTRDNFYTLWAQMYVSELCVCIY